jgi:Cohesin domain
MAPDLDSTAQETQIDPKPVAVALNLAAPVAAIGAPAKSVSNTQSAIAGNLDVSPLTSASSSSQFVWHGPAQTKAGNAFQATLSSSLSQPLGQIPIVLRYDPMALTFKAVSPGEIATRAGIDQISSKVDDVTGKIEFTLQSKANKLSGQGSLANVIFEAKGYKSTTTLTASQVDMKQPDGSVRSIRPPKPYTMRITQ